MWKCLFNLGTNSTISFLCYLAVAMGIDMGPLSCVHSLLLIDVAYPSVALSFLLVSNISMMILIALASLGCWRNNNTTIGFVTNTQDLWVSWCYYTTCTGGPFKTYTRLLHNSILWVITVWAQNLGFVLMKQNFYTH